MYKIENQPVQQGEVRIERIASLPIGIETKNVERVAGGFVISHSESGHHHLLSGGSVMERTNDVPVGMQVIYAVLDKTERFFQSAANPHGEYEMNPGIYEMRISREFDPFSEMARRVAD